MEYAADELIKILQRWPPINESSAYLYATERQIEITTCDHASKSLSMKPWYSYTERIIASLVMQSADYKTMSK